MLPFPVYPSNMKGHLLFTGSFTVTVVKTMGKIVLKFNHRCLQYSSRFDD